MIAIILAKKIFSLFLIMAMSMALVKLKLLDSKESRCISVMLLYMFFPCVILKSFQVDCTPEVKSGLMLGVGAAIIVHVLLLVLGSFFEKTLHLNPVEKCSVIYSNSGNLIIPIVGSVLGPEWVIYSSSFIAVQLVLFWTHLKSTLEGATSMDWKKVFTNGNMIAIIIGLVLFFTGWRFPAPVQATLSDVGGMVGPAAMIIAGMLLGNVDFKELCSHPRLPLVAALRLVIVPFIVAVLLKYSGMAALVPNGETILLITLLATATPSATTVVSMALLYGSDSEYASAINVVTAILCIITMPLIVAFYQL